MVDIDELRRLRFLILQANIFLKAEPLVSSDGSVTHWIADIKAHDEDAARQLWQRYFDRLVRLARKKLVGFPRRVADEEDVVISAFDSFVRGAEEGRFPDLRDRNNLWSLLVVITARKAVDQIQHERRKKRGSGNVAGDSIFNRGSQNDANAGFDMVVGKEPTPEFAAAVIEEYERLLGALNGEDLRNIALWKMEGYTNEEIAKRIGRQVRTVERKLQLIRKAWQGEAPQ